MNIQQADLRVTVAGDITYKSAPTIRVGQLTKSGFKIGVICHNASCPWTSANPRTTAAEAISDLVAHLSGTDQRPTRTTPAPAGVSRTQAATPTATNGSRPRGRAQARVSVPQIFPVSRA